MSVQIIYDAPAHLTMPERFLLYSLIYGLRPASVLEIGIAQGGAALESNLTLGDVDNPGVPQKDATRMRNVQSDRAAYGAGTETA